MKNCLLLAVLACLLSVANLSADDKSPTRDEAFAAMKKASTYYYENVATHGGYVYFYSLDLKVRWGEGLATKDQVWVQPPGTPTVGMAYLKAYEATGDKFYLEAATAAAEALVYGQVKSGGWTNVIDFDPRGERVSQYRNGKGRGRNTSSLDDGQTASAILLLIQVDAAHDFKHAKIHEAAQFALKALLNAQYPNGAFPQVWQGEAMPDPPAKKASFPDYDWRTENRIKEYWNMYTLNDDVAGYAARTLIEAHNVYKEERFKKAVVALGDFLIAAQLPEPQPGWAQQYNYDMKPVWARKFEPPGVSGDETQEVIRTLITIFNFTGDEKYLAPIPAALDWLEKSKISNTQIARYYELKTNKPLYMQRKGKVYSLTYDDSNLPSHYGWKINAKIRSLRTNYVMHMEFGQRAEQKQRIASSTAAKIIAQLDDNNRWVSTYQGEKLVGQPKFKVGAKYLSSEEFSNNISYLARYIEQEK